VFEGGRPAGNWGAWGDDAPSAQRFRRAPAGGGPLDGLPSEIRSALGDGGRGALALESAHGPVVVPVAWTAAGSGLYAAAGEDAFALAAPATSTPRAALGVDRPSAWRARHMVGAMARGVAEIHVARRLASGERSARAIAAASGTEGDDVAVVRLRAERFVWWRGWTSGTVGT
jgi:hypothetical protein